MTARLAERPLKVFKVRFNLAMPDPDVPGPRYHTVLFVESREAQKGHIHHVTGDLISGMHYESTPADRPEDDQTRSFFTKELLGMVDAVDYPEQFDAICAPLPTPSKQKAFNIKTMRTEPIKPDGTFYAAGEGRRPLFKCTEWTEQYAIPALMKAKIVK